MPPSSVVPTTVVSPIWASQGPLHRTVDDWEAKVAGKGTWTKSTEIPDDDTASLRCSVELALQTLQADNARPVAPEEITLPQTPTLPCEMDVNDFITVCQDPVLRMQAAAADQLLADAFRTHNASSPLVLQLLRLQEEQETQMQEYAERGASREEIDLLLEIHEHQLAKAQEEVDKAREALRTSQQAVWYQTISALARGLGSKLAKPPTKKEAAAAKTAATSPNPAVAVQAVGVALGMGKMAAKAGMSFVAGGLQLAGFIGKGDNGTAKEPSDSATTGTRDVIEGTPTFLLTIPATNGASTRGMTVEQPLTAIPSG
eukprot:Sspe_Gene.93884::Locus_66385_Transcript_2_2_Confidence_0.667_Length_988::g.93884::m.93884